LAAELSGRLVGAFVAGIKPWHDGNHLTDGELFVDPDYQKQGIGSLLSIAMCQKALRKYHATRFDAITFSDRDFPLTWYRDQGFKEVRNWTIISGDIKEVLHHLQKGKIR
ncbi:GNAT family N-acetyltransferase, partial [Candidatus Woesearchaeota archaeon]|nr:GNAT family N-acetyltransferase [Candidatus Woesearchaeota archaeon]